MHGIGRGRLRAPAPRRLRRRARGADGLARCPPEVVARGHQDAGAAVQAGRRLHGRHGPGHRRRPVLRHRPGRRSRRAGTGPSRARARRPAREDHRPHGRRPGRSPPRSRRSSRCRRRRSRRCRARSCASCGTSSTRCWRPPARSTAADARPRWRRRQQPRSSATMARRRGPVASLTMVTGCRTATGAARVRAAAALARGAAFGARLHGEHRVAMPAISVEHLSKSYGDTVAVRDVSFEVEKGRSSRSSGPMEPARPPPSRSSRAFATAPGGGSRRSASTRPTTARNAGSAPASGWCSRSWPSSRTTRCARS